MWLTSYGFVDKVKSWASYTYQGFPSFIVSSKLKTLKNGMRNSLVILTSAKKLLLSEIQEIEVVADE